MLISFGSYERTPAEGEAEVESSEKAVQADRRVYVMHLYASFSTSFNEQIQNKYTLNLSYGRGTTEHIPFRDKTERKRQNVRGNEREILYILCIHYTS